MFRTYTFIKVETEKDKKQDSDFEAFVISISR